MQQATLNLLADMGAQAGSKQSDLVAATASSDTIAPTSTITSPAAGATVPVGTPLTITGTAVDSGGGQVAAVEVSVDGGQTWKRATGRNTWSYVFTPTSPLGPRTIRSRAIDDSLNIETPSAGRTIEVGPRPLPASIWSNQDVPRVPSANDPSAVELGVRFRPVIDGFITGLRFYKGAGNTGTHVGHLWTATGQPLATITFSGETATGWQTMPIDPVPVTAGTTYVASCHMPNGNFSIDSGYFQSTGRDVWPLRALANGEDGSNGLYRYGPPAFPTDSFGAANYWVDVLFDTDDHRAPTLIDHAPAAGLESVAPSTTVSVQFSEAMTASSIVLELRDPANQLVTGATSYSSATRQRDVHSGDSADGPHDLHGATRRRPGTARASRSTAPFTWAFTTTGAPGTIPTSIWDSSAAPAVPVINDSPVELGVKFRSDIGGSLTALRFYKAPGAGGPHVGRLWNAAGQLLATVTFANESASGWQQADLATPVVLVPGAVYVASYHAVDGRFALTAGYFNSTDADRGPIHAPPHLGGVRRQRRLSLRAHRWLPHRHAQRQQLLGRCRPQGPGRPTGHRPRTGTRADRGLSDQAGPGLLRRAHHPGVTRVPAP